MATEFGPHDSIEDAIDETAKGAVKKSVDSLGQSVEYFSLAELMEAERRRAAAVAATKSHFGLRMTKCVPPGTG